MISELAPKTQTDWASRQKASRPILSETQAARFSREAVLAYVGPAGDERFDPWEPSKPVIGQDDKTKFLVDQTGRTQQCFVSIQDAIDAALELERERIVPSNLVICIKPGIYSGLVYVPKLRSAASTLSIVGAGNSPTDTVISANIDAEMPVGEYIKTFGPQFENAGAEARAIFDRMAQGDRLGTFRSSVLRIEAQGTVLQNLTVHNTYQANRTEAAPKGAKVDELGRYSQGQHQAVALHIAGADKVWVNKVHLKSFQDTLYLAAPDKASTSRSCFTECSIEGDVDFIFGQSSAYFERCNVRSLGVRKAKSWVVAPATNVHTKYGFVFSNCTFSHDGAPYGVAGGCCLGRQWFEGVRATPYGSPQLSDYQTKLSHTNQFRSSNSTVSADSIRSVGKCILLNCKIGPHISRHAPWDDWSGPGYDAAGILSEGAWSPRYRPHQTSLTDMLAYLGGWAEVSALKLDRSGAEGPWLGEFETMHLKANSHEN